MSDLRIERKPVELYETYLKDKSRPPSRGGNTRAWHQHVLTIGGEKFSFLALGARKWVFAKDFVSFDWAWDATSRFRNVIPETLVTWTPDGKVVQRGDRGKKKWRTADARPPGRRSEWAD